MLDVLLLSTKLYESIRLILTGVPGIGCLATAGPGPHIEVVGLEYTQVLRNIPYQAINTKLVVRSADPKGFLFGSIQSGSSSTLTGTFYNC